MTIRHHIIEDTPLGPLTIVLDGDAVSALYMTEHRHAPGPETFGPPADSEDPLVLRVVSQLDEYFAGDRQEFDLPLAARGTQFQATVWKALQEIPYGMTVTYGELAQRIGSPRASRAVGLANGRNPISIIVPCHRVIGASGDLTGYGGGIERKRALLALEKGQQASA